MHYTFLKLHHHSMRELRFSSADSCSSQSQSTDPVPTIGLSKNTQWFRFTGQAFILVLSRRYPRAAKAQVHHQIKTVLSRTSGWMQRGFFVFRKLGPDCSVYM